MPNVENSRQALSGAAAQQGQVPQHEARHHMEASKNILAQLREELEQIVSRKDNLNARQNEVEVMIQAEEAKIGTLTQLYPDSPKAMPQTEAYTEPPFPRA